MKSFDQYVREETKKKLNDKYVCEIVSKTMVGIHELMTDDTFLNWFEKLSDKILNKMSMYEIYQKYLKEVKKK